MHKCVNSPEQISRSITQIQKLFQKGRTKKLCGTVFTNVFISQNKDIENMLEDLKSSIERCDGKIGKQRIQHHDEKNIGFILHLLTNIEAA